MKRRAMVSSIEGGPQRQRSRPPEQDAFEKPNKRLFDSHTRALWSCLCVIQKRRSKCAFLSGRPCTRSRMTAIVSIDFVACVACRISLIISISAFSRGQQRHEKTYSSVLMVGTAIQSASIDAHEFSLPSHSRATSSGCSGKSVRV